MRIPSGYLKLDLNSSIIIMSEQKNEWEDEGGAAGKKFNELNVDLICGSDDPETTDGR